MQDASSAAAIIVNSLNAQVVAKRSPGGALQLDLPSFCLNAALFGLAAGEFNPHKAVIIAFGGIGWP